MNKPLHTIGRLLALAIAGAGGWVAVSMCRAGEWFIGGAFALALATALLIYLSPRTNSSRYLFPGLAAFAVFVLFPLGYTVFIAFTNFSAEHLLSLDRAKQFFLVETYALSPAEYDFAVEEISRKPVALRLHLRDRQAPDRQWQTEAFAPDQTSVQCSKDAPAAWEAFGQASTIRLAAQYRRTLKHLEVQPPAGEALRMADLRTFAPLRPLWRAGENDTLVNQQTGEVLRPDKTKGYFQNARGENLDPGFRVTVGWENFTALLHDRGLRQPFLRIFAWNLAFAALSVLITFAVGMLLANLLEWEALRYRNVYRALLILPYAVPAFISILVFRGLFNANYGEINMVLHALFGVRPEWFTNPWLARLMILLVNTWLGYPYMMIIASGMLQSLPRDLYEASAIEGAGPWRNFWDITLPLILPPLLPLLIASFAFNFNNFLLIFLLTGGRPDIPGAATVAGQTDLLVTYTFRVAFRDSAARFGYASAVATLLFILVALLSYLNLALTQRTQPARRK